MSVKFTGYDSETIVSRLVAQFENALGETLQPSDERRIFLNQLAQVVVQIGAEINHTGNQVLLRYASGESLDAIGEMFGVKRLPSAYAKCTLEFTLSEAQSMNVVIPRGTRATPDGNVYFATDKELLIKAGETSGTVEATATQTGVSNNGFSIGQIKYIVDNVQFLSKVSNTTASIGGTDGETDDSLRERIRLVHESYSTAGCADGYIYWAKSASADVGDVEVYSPVNDASLTEEERKAGAGEVYVYILKSDGTIPTADDPLLTTVYKSVSAKDKRPLTDKVTVAPPTAVKYSINFKYYISEEDEIRATDIRAKVAESVDAYVKWQGEKIGRDINPDKLRNLILNAGASRVTMTSPTFTSVNNRHIALLNGSIIAEYEGISE